MDLNSFYKNKKIFLTGHTGFKGSWLSLWLNSMGAKVCGYSLEPPTNPSLFHILSLDKKIEKHIIGDVRDIEFLKKSIQEFKPDIIFHLAAQPLVRESYKIPVDTYSTNVMGTINLFESIRLSIEQRMAIVNVTTDKVYDNKEWIWGYRENEPLGGYDPYSNSKACSELVTSSYRNSFFHPSRYREHQVGIATARAGNVIGGGDFASDRLIPDIIRSILAREKVLIRNPKSIRPWQYVLEPLNGYMLLAKNLYDEGSIYSEAWNFGPYERDAKTVEEIVESLKLKIKNKTNFDFEYQLTSGIQPHEANYLKLDISKSMAQLDWKPKWNMDVALDKILNWTLEWQNGNSMEAVCLNQIAEYEAQEL